MLSLSGARQALGLLAWLLFIGSSVHVASTGWFYTLGDVRDNMARHKTRYIWVPLGFMAGLAVVATVAPQRVLVNVLVAYFAWQLFHFQKQNLGLVALSASSTRAKPVGRAERRVIMASGLAGMTGLVAHPGLARLTVTSPVPWLFPLAGATVAGAFVVGLILLARRPPRDRPAAYASLFMTALIFNAPLFLFASPYAALGGMIVAHGLQYLLLVILVGTGGRERSQTAVGLAWLTVIGFGGGLLLVLASHLHGGPPAGRLLYGLFLGVVTAHFVVDAGLWRLRDDFPRRFLSERLPYLVPRHNPANLPSH